MNYFIAENYIKATFGDIEAYIFMMDINSILPIYYVAVRGRDDIEGAVQRVLNKRRIASISDFVLEGNMFFNTFILNWTDENYTLEINENSVKIPIVRSAAQVIDGQHRLEGLKMACEKNEEIGDQEIIVILANKLNTADAARIFLNINNEQKPAPKSLVYDLFGEVKDKNYYLVRAHDIAEKMHNDPEAPYYQSIKLPGSAYGVGKIDSSAVVNALKQYTVEDGIFKQYNLNDFESQYKVINNFFQVIKYYYEKERNWLKNKNPFMMNAGFFAAIKFLCEDLIPKCAYNKSFEITTMKNIMKMDEQGLIYKDDIKNMQGKEQRNEIYKYLKSLMLRDVPNNNEYKF